MLVLARRKKEKLFIDFGEAICVIELLEVHGQQIRIGITAPKEVSIHRGEAKKFPERYVKLLAQLERGESSA